MDNQLMNLGLTERDGKAVVSSRDIARVFEKRHDHVLRDIKNIIVFVKRKVYHCDHEKVYHHG